MALNTLSKKFVLQILTSSEENIALAKRNTANEKNDKKNLILLTFVANKVETKKWKIIIIRTIKYVLKKRFKCVAVKKLFWNINVYEANKIEKIITPWDREKNV